MHEPVTIRLEPFQAEAVRRAAAIMRRHGGVIICDAVGSGKTYIAIALIEEALLGPGAVVLVTAPASLRSQWLTPLRRIGAAVGADVVTLANGTEPPVSTGGPRPRRVLWLSHTAFSLDRTPSTPPDLIVVDEAHAFRNPRTRRYRVLARTCRSAIVVLLTATPVNNSLMDLYHLLRLFLCDDSLADAGVPDLRAAFGSASRTIGGAPGPQLAAAIAAVTVRRGRSAIARSMRGFRLPRREPPIAVRYDVGGTPAGEPDSIATSIERLELRPFGVGTAVPGLAELLRFMLLKRLESSTAALMASLLRLRQFLSAFIDAADAGYLLRPRDHSNGDGGAANGDQLLLIPLALRPMPHGCDARALIGSARRDQAVVQSLLGARTTTLRAWSSAVTSDVADAKARRLLGLIDQLGNRRILVFTEFRDTALYLWRLLRNRRPVAVVHGGGARIGDSASTRREAIVRFAPYANGAPPPPPHARIDVLIATDVLSEGHNLQDAADLVSYDLPWNPVRLMQRVGRIDRLGSPHASIRVYNFIPDRQLDSLLGIVDRLAAKLDAIRAASGSASHWIASSSTLAGTSKQSDDRVNRDAMQRARDVIGRIVSGDPDLFEALDTDAAAFDPMPTSIAAEPPPTVLELAGLPALDRRKPNGESAGPGAGGLRPHANVVGKGLARRLMGMIARHPGGADDELCTRADAVLERLRTGMRAGDEIELAMLLRRTRVPTATRPGNARALVSALEGVLCCGGAHVRVRGAACRISRESSRASSPLNVRSNRAPRTRP